MDIRRRAPRLPMHFEFKPTKNLIRPADSHSSRSMTDKEINPSPEGVDLNLQRFTPFRISNAQMHHNLSLKMPPKVGISNEKWCKRKQIQRPKTITFIPIPIAQSSIITEEIKDDLVDQIEEQVKLNQLIVAEWDRKLELMRTQEIEMRRTDVVRELNTLIQFWNNANP